MELVDSNLERSYLSLQPPPGRIIEDDIQFETLDLYLWTGPQFSVPSLLFYAGPVYQEGVDDISAQIETTSSEVRMLWRLWSKSLSICCELFMPSAWLA